MDDPSALALPRPPGPRRALRGATILAVEDSRFACESLRLMCRHSGARLRRADCLASARRHLRVYRPAAVIVDLGLPDGSGAGLIAELARARPRIAALVGMSGDPGGADLALAAGADGFLAKPVDSLARFQQCLRVLLARDAAQTPPPACAPDPAALRDDMGHAAALLARRQDGAAISYAAQFLGGVARAARDPALERAAGALAECRPGGGRRRAHAARLVAMLRARIGNAAAI